MKLGTETDDVKFETNVLKVRDKIVNVIIDVKLKTNILVRIEIASVTFPLSYIEAIVKCDYLWLLTVFCSSFSYSNFPGSAAAREAATKDRKPTIVYGMS